MNLAVSIKFEGLLRNLRLAGHALAEHAERAAGRAEPGGVSDGPARAAPRVEREKEGKRR